MIFDVEPWSWQQIQTFVGRMFKEFGFDTEVSKVIELVRGHKEIDVYARDLECESQPTILVKCKFWNSPIPQEVIYH